MRNRTPLKIVGLSILALVSVMVVNVSAAQGKWLLLRSGESVLQLNLSGPLLLSELLVPGLGLEIHCPEGSINVTLTLDGTHKTLADSLSISQYKCKVLDFGDSCTIKSPGAAVGEIKSTASGQVAMTGEEVYALASSNQISVINFEGAECPLSEIGGTISGSEKLTLQNPLKDDPEHLAKLDEDGVFFDEEAMQLHGELLTPGTRDPWVLAHLKESSAVSWAIHLVGL